MWERKEFLLMTLKWNLLKKSRIALFRDSAGDDHAQCHFEASP